MKHVMLGLDRSMQFLLDSPVKPGNDDFKVFNNTVIRKATFKNPPLNPLPSREGQFLSPLSLDGRGQG